MVFCEDPCPQNDPGERANAHPGPDPPCSTVTRRGLAVKATRICSVEGCEKPVRARGWCSTHHQRWRVHGSPDVVLRAANGAYGPGSACSVDGCERRPTRGGMCTAHYQRQRKFGDPGSVEIMDRSDIVGKVFGRLTVVGRHTAGSRDLRWRCRCECGTVTAVYRWHLQQGHVSSCGCLARELLRKPDDQITYNSAHYRVKRLKGSASRHPCAHCGDDAFDWAMSHTAAVTYLGNTNGYPVRYSGDPEDYIPLCRPCHGRYDRRRS